MSVDTFRVNRSELRWNGSLYGYGDTLTRDQILSVNPSKLGTLLRTKTIVEDERGTPLDSRTMADLRDLARDVGIEGPLPRAKADLISEIEGAKHG